MTRVYRLDMTLPDLDKTIVASSDKQLQEGFKLISTFVVGTDLVLIYQNVDKIDSTKPTTT